MPLGASPRISAMAEADLDASDLAAMCRPRYAARGLRIGGLTIEQVCRE